MAATPSLLRRLRGRLRWHAHWRCVEPIVVVESDDWGLERRPCGDLLRQFGEPKVWADESSATPDDLARLTSILTAHCDAWGRPVCFTANFVVANPDFESIEADRFRNYHESPIGNDDAILEAWREAARLRVFFPQYHGRSHFWPEAWLEDLRDGENVARELFAARHYGGLLFLKGQGWRHHSEYLHWKTGAERSPAELASWLRDGIAIFEKVFGFPPLSSIAPHYVLPVSATRAWRDNGIRFAQGAGQRILRRHDSRRRTLSHVLGERSANELVFLCRTVKFEPGRAHAPWGTATALEQVRSCFRHHVPAVVDSHRINYTGQFRDPGLAGLARLLESIAPLKPLFLTTTELGEAIANGGRFHDSFNGAERRLTPIRSAVGLILRTWWKDYHSRLARGAESATGSTAGNLER